MGDKIFGQKANVLGEEGDEELQDEPLRQRALHLALDELVEGVSQGVGGLAGDGFAVVAEAGLARLREEKGQRPPAAGQLGQGERVLGESSCVSKS